MEASGRYVQQLAGFGCLCLIFFILDMDGCL
jgi:hypothetical protein